MSAAFNLNKDNTRILILIVTGLWDLHKVSQLQRRVMNLEVGILHGFIQEFITMIG